MILEKEIEHLESVIPHADKTIPSISAKGVDWHIDHSLRALLAMGNATLDSDPRQYRSEFNIKRIILFTLGKIPRGKAKAPDFVIAKEAIELEGIRKKVERSKEMLEKFPEADKHKFFKHPIIGILNKKQALKMMTLHTRHHINIIDDIIAHADN
jgi:hypothetical protein